MNIIYRSRYLLLGTALGWLPGLAAAAVDYEALLDMDMTELLEVQVTSVAKKAQKLSDSAAAIFVITSDDLRRSGVRSIPEALRMVPGVQAARINSYAYAIGVRGFDSSFSNKLLVLVDGRTVYTPEFSGVYWSMVDYPLDDIDRIEVIRGPGGTLWGANAVNGVINIITKSAKDTGGTLLKAGGGDNDEEYFFTARHGANLDPEGNTHFRAYAKIGKRGDFPLVEGGTPVGDHWSANRGGFRLDSAPTGEDTLSVQGDVFSINIGTDTINDEVGFIAHIEQSGTNLSGKWDHRYAAESNTQLQVYASNVRYQDESLLTFENRTLDFEFQHQFPLAEKHDFLWGVGYRHLHSHTTFGLIHEFRPPLTKGDLFNLFAQDDFHISETLRLTAGLKLEQHYYTGLEWQPNLRLLWKPSGETTWWGSVSRAVRTPSRFEYSSYVEFPGFTRSGNDQSDAEILFSYELGWRHRFSSSFSVDAATFFNDYDKLLVVDNSFLEDGTDFGILENGMQAEAYGLEVSANWFIKPWWRVHAAYSWLNLEAHLDEGINTQDYAYDPATETRDPEHQVSLRSSIDLGDNWDLDVWLRHIGELEQYAETAIYSGIDAHTDLDIRLAWRPMKNLEFSVTGRNLLEEEHTEFGEEPLQLYFINGIPRTVYGQIKLTF